MSEKSKSVGNENVGASVGASAGTEVTNTSVSAGVEAGAEVNVTENVFGGTNVTVSRVGKDITINSLGGG